MDAVCKLVQSADTPVASGATLVVAGFDAAPIPGLEAQLSGTGRIIVVSAAGHCQSLGHEGREAAGVVLLAGPDCSLGQAERLAAYGAGSGAPLVVLDGTPSRSSLHLRQVLGQDRIFFVCPGALAPAALARIIDAASSVVSANHLELLAEAGVTAHDAVSRRQMLALEQRLAASARSADAAHATCTAVSELLAVAAVRCLCAGRSGAVPATAWLRGEPAEETNEGIAVYVLRTGDACRCSAGEQDPRFVAAADAPATGARCHLLAVAVPAVAAAPVAVLVAERSADQAAFSAGEQAAVEAMAACVAPYLTVALRRTAPERDTGGGENERLFRAEALRAHTRGAHDQGRWLLDAPEPGRRSAFWLLGCALVAMVIACFVPIREYVGGPAVVRIGERTEVSARFAGTVRQLPVVPGERVRAGQPLVYFYSESEAAEIGLLERAFETSLRRRLERPGERSTEAPVMAARTALERARVRLEQLTIRAPVAGTVRDLRIRPGAYPAASDVMMTLVTDHTSRLVKVFLPGNIRPKLARGQALRLEIAGFPYAYQRLLVSAVDEAVVGPGEGRLVLGSSLADSVQVDGAVALVEAQIQGASFESGGRRYNYFDGMQATAEVLVGSEPLVFHLFPALRSLWGKS